MQASEPSVNDGKIAVDLRDDSGISEVALYYSFDRVSWNSTTLSLETGTSYSQKPISSVSQDTVVHYYLKAVDGAGNPYYIGTADSCYNYTLKAPLLSILQSPRNLGILSVIVVFFATVTGVIVFRKRAKKRCHRLASYRTLPKLKNDYACSGKMSVAEAVYRIQSTVGSKSSNRGSIRIEYNFASCGKVIAEPRLTSVCSEPLTKFPVAIIVKKNTNNISIAIDILFLFIHIASLLL